MFAELARSGGTISERACCIVKSDGAASSGEKWRDSQVVIRTKQQIDWSKRVSNDASPKFGATLRPRSSESRRVNIKAYSGGGWNFSDGA